jgi:hypothetical protein
MSEKIDQPKSDGALGTQKAQIQRDHWFDSQLNELFNHVVSEPLPSDLADLIDQLKAGDRQN